MLRQVREGDRDLVRELWEQYEDERGAPIRETWDEAWPDLVRHIREGVALFAEEEGQPVGFVFGTFRTHAGGDAHIVDLYVRPASRRRGLAKQLIGAVAEQGASRGVPRVSLDVSLENAVARAVYERLGFRAVSQLMISDVETLQDRLGAREAGPSFGSVHVQTDDVGPVERAVRQFVPRLPGGSRGSVVSPPRNGWIAVYDELCDRDPAMLRRLGRELSDRMGAVVVVLGVEEGQVARYVLLEGGRVVDEYLSVPEYHGPLPPGDIVALGANPTAVARLTGADAAEVRAAARTASSPDDLPPAAEVLAAIAGAMRLEGADHGYSGAAELPEAIQIAPA